jgi:hypothetical protein
MLLKFNGKKLNDTFANQMSRANEKNRKLPLNGNNTMLIKIFLVVYCFSTLIPFSLQIRFLSMLSWLNISYIFIGQIIEFLINYNFKIYIGKLTRGLEKE